MNRVKQLFPVLLLASFACAAWHVQIIKLREGPTADHSLSWTHTDLMPVWMGSRKVLGGINPYSDDATRGIQVAYYGRALTAQELRRVNHMGFAYPAYTAFVFAPLALLPWTAAHWLALLLMIALTGASVPAWMSVLDVPLEQRRIFLYGGIAFACWPVLWGLRLENPSMIMVPLMALACALMRRRPVVAGILLGAAAVKPQLAGLLLAMLAMRAFTCRSWRFLLSLSGTLLALVLGAEIRLPGWIMNWRAAMADYASYTHVSPILPLRVSIGLAVLCLWPLWRLRKAFGAGVSLSLAATMALMPVNWPTSYNLILLMPALMLLYKLKPAGAMNDLRRLGLATLAFELVAVPLGGLCDILHGPPDLFYATIGLNLLVPLVVAFVLAVVTLTRNGDPSFASRPAPIA